MFGLGAGEVFLICALGLIFVGPKKIPELARSLGRGLRAFQSAKDEVAEELRRVEHGDSNDSNDGDDEKKNKKENKKENEKDTEAEQRKLDFKQEKN